jgi:hypothetical protein
MPNPYNRYSLQQRFWIQRILGPSLRIGLDICANELVVFVIPNDRFIVVALPDRGLIVAEAIDLFGHGGFERANDGRD